MPMLDRKGLLAALDRFSQVDSVLRSDRVCLAIAQGRLSDFGDRYGFVVHRTGTTLPWLLRPLAIIISAGRCVVELTQPTSVATFAEEADDCFIVTFCSFSRTVLPSVLSHLQSDGWEEAAGVADRDPTYAELEFNCDGDSHDRWLVMTRFNRDCPPDLSQCLLGIDELEDASTES
jgi:hypothetical protein